MKAKPLTRKNISASLELHAKISSYGDVTDSMSEVMMGIIEWAEAHGLNKEELKKWIKEKRK